MFYDCFPKEFQDDLNVVLKIIPTKTYHDVQVGYSEKTIDYKLNEDVVKIPYRIYFIDVEYEKIGCLTETQKIILYCIYTRSCNGYIREKYLKKLLDTDFEEWVIPFIVKLCDEYVVEILEVIYQNLKDRNNEDIKLFCWNNKELLKKSYSRMVSYWNEYYRNKENHFHRYVGRKLFRECLGYNRMFERF